MSKLPCSFSEHQSSWLFYLFFIFQRTSLLLVVMLSVNKQGTGFSLSLYKRHTSSKEKKTEKREARRLFFKGNLAESGREKTGNLEDVDSSVHAHPHYVYHSLVDEGQTCLVSVSYRQRRNWISSHFRTFEVEFDFREGRDSFQFVERVFVDVFPALIRCILNCAKQTAKWIKWKSKRCKCTTWKLDIRFQIERGRKSIQ